MAIDVRWQTLSSWWYSSILVASFVFIKYFYYFKYRVDYLTKLHSPTFLRRLVCLGIFYFVCGRLVLRRSHNCWKLLTNFTFDFYIDICVPFNSYSAACFVQTNRFSLLLEWRFTADVVVVFIFSFSSCGTFHRIMISMNEFESSSIRLSQKSLSLSLSTRSCFIWQRLYKHET